MAYATVTDVEDRFERDLTDKEKRQVGEWIADLASDIGRRVKNLEAKCADDADYARTVKSVIAETVIVKLRNPEGLRQLTTSIDDFSTTKTVDRANSSGRLTISDEDWDRLLPAVSGRAFSIRLGGSPGYADHQRW